MQILKNSNSDSPTHHCDDSPTRRVGELATPRLAESSTLRPAEFFFQTFKSRLPDSASRWVVDSPIRRVGESATPRLAESESPQLADSLSRGVVFRLLISQQIRSQKRNGSKGGVRDLWGPNFCKNPRKSASLPCPFKLIEIFGAIFAYFW